MNESLSDLLAALERLGPPSASPGEWAAVRRLADRLRRDLAEEETLADLGALAAVVVHEVGNFLNLALLQLAMLELDAGQPLGGEMANIHRQAKGLGDLLKQWRDYRQRRQPPTEVIDLHEVVRAAAAGPDPAPDLRLTPGPAPVHGTHGDLRRLVRFLLSAAAAARAGGPVTLRTELTAEQVLLCADDTGPAVAGELLPQMFSAAASVRPGPSRLELAACQKVARALGGTVTARNRPGGGVTVCVSLPRAGGNGQAG